MARKSVDPLKHVREYERANREAAAIIAGNREYDGSVMATWAAMILDKTAAVPKNPKPDLEAKLPQGTKGQMRLPLGEVA